MLATIAVGIVFASILAWAILRTKKDLKSSKCAGCGVDNCSSRK